MSENFGDVVEVKRYTTSDDLVLDLTGGRIDMVLLDFPVGESAILKDSNYQVLGEQIQIGDGMGVAFRKRDGDLATKFNAALKKLKENGTYDEIMNKYFAYSIKM